MNTAKQLISAFVDAPPLYWDRSYVQNMREIRGYPNWWRIRDDVAYIDGPPNEGEQYTKDLYVWSVEIVKDEDTGENTNKLELYDLDNTLEESTSVVNGETIYRWKYREQEPELTYEHTDVIDSVSLEFDQLGRRMVAFESNGDVFLIWYDSQAGTTVVTNFGSGYNPQIVTDTYRRTGGSADSERLLFYVDSTTKQIVYRKQLDRFGVVYTLPSAPSDIVELLKVSKNLYGGLTALYCYEVSGELQTGSFTARYAEDIVAVGTDRYSESQSALVVDEGEISLFTLKLGAIGTPATDYSSFAVGAGEVTSFVLRSAQVYLPEQKSNGSFQTSVGLVNEFKLKSAIVVVGDSSSMKDSSSFVGSAGNVTSFFLKKTRITTTHSSQQGIQILSGNVTNFVLG